MATQTACQQCGVPVSAGARFCANCGADVSAEQGSAPTRRMNATQAMHDALLDRVRHAALGEYEILTELGRGGMATVYLAHDIQLDRKVALKVMLPSLLEGDDMVERFRLEARTAAQLSHPHIIPIYAVRATENLVYFVMKFVEGRPLDAIIKELGPLPIPMVRSILSRVGEALGYAHRKGVVHRDIKPANLMIDVEGQPIVTDFGIAKVADARGLTMSGTMIGTPTYMSPEQCSAGDITGASDQYSLGVVAYQMIAGRVPFEAESIVGLLYKHVHEDPGDLLRARADCPPSLAAAVTRMLAKDPHARFPTMEAAVEAIGAVTLAFDDPIRTQLVGLAKQGESVAALRRVSTPRSPIPLRARTTTAVPEVDSEPRATTVPTPAEPKRSRLPMVGGVLVAVVGALLWWRPWDPATTTPDTDAGARVVAASDSTAPSGPRAVTGPPSTPATEPAATPDPAPANGPATDVASAVVAAVRVTGAPAALTVGDQGELRAVAVDPQGNALPGRSITWTSLDPSRATVSPRGVITARAPGEVTLIARSGESSQRVALRIDPRRPASVSLSAAPSSLLVGATARLSATVVDANGREIPAAVSWRSADPRIASVSDGIVSAEAPGVTTISAMADGRESSVSVRVTAPETATPAPAAPAPVTSARVEAPPVDPRVAIDEVIQRYARALESRQLSAVRAVYPGMTAQQESQFTRTLATLERLKVTLRTGAPTLVGDEATASVSGTYEFYSPENRRTEQLPVSVTATLVRGPTGWQIRSIR